MRRRETIHPAKHLYVHATGGIDSNYIHHGRGGGGGGGGGPDPLAGSALELLHSNGHDFAERFYFHVAVYIIYILSLCNPSAAVAWVCVRE